MRFITLSLVLILAGSVPVSARGLPPALAKAAARAGVSASHVGLVIQPLDKARPSLAVNADQPLNPASLMKIVTTLAALDTLGPAHTFKTAVLINGSLADGVLKGDLVIRGGGDPALNLEHFRTLLGEIRARGVRRIEGNVILDHSLFAIDPADPGAFDGEPLQPYNANPDALLVNYNVLPLYLAPEGKRIGSHLEPPGIAIDNSLSLSDAPACTDWEDALSMKLDNGRLDLSGPYPAACGERSVWLNLMSPSATVASLFAATWTELGGSLSGIIRSGNAPATATPLLEFASPELSDIVRGTNKYSNNVMAKMLLLDLGVARYGAPGTWDKGRDAILAWLKERGLELPGLVIENGSGLSRTERLSPESLARLLVWASGQPLYYEFAASLPAVGLEGTQRRRLKDTPLAGRAWLKSGSLDGVRNLAGYVLDTSGRRKALVLFIHDTPAHNAAMFQEVVLEWTIGGRVLP